ncbi:MAG: dihydropteroate synthase, partial [Lacunisphaera sp.]
MNPRPLNLIGELINNSYARARKAFTERSAADYAHLAKLQADLGVKYLTVNLDGTARIQVKMAEMLALLPDVIPAIQAATNVPLSFDNPAVEYHK